MRGEEVVKRRRLHLGSDQEHTVYEAELVGMILAVKMLQEEGAGRGGSMALGVDNQAAIRSTKAFHSQPGHYLVDQLHDDLRKLIPDDDERKMIIRWTPGHKGILGNEAADEEAKRAANGESSECRELPKAFPSRRNQGRSQRRNAQLPTIRDDPLDRSHSTIQQIRAQDRLTPEKTQLPHLPTPHRPHRAQQISFPTSMPRIHEPAQRPQRQDRPTQMQPQTLDSETSHHQRRRK